MSNPDLQVELSRLRRRFAARLPERIAQIDRTAAAGELEPLHLLLHRLAGSGGAFGFADISGAARDAEGVVREALRPRAGSKPDRLESLAEHLARLRQLCARATADGGG